MHSDDIVGLIQIVLYALGFFIWLACEISRECAKENKPDVEAARPKPVKVKEPIKGQWKSALIFICVGYIGLLIFLNIKTAEQAYKCSVNGTLEHELLLRNASGWS